LEKKSEKKKTTERGRREEFPRTVVMSANFKGANKHHQVEKSIWKP